MLLESLIGLHILIVDKDVIQTLNKRGSNGLAEKIDSDQVLI